VKNTRPSGATAIAVGELRFAAICVSVKPAGTSASSARGSSGSTALRAADVTTELARRARVRRAAVVV
jgi:hypothetical protein